LDLAGKKILVTAGPTYEPIDPVRFIGNYSSGKMGYAIADELCAHGADVTLVSGPVSILPKHKNINLIKVNTATEMYEACNQCFKLMDAAILSAAVADYTPKNPSETKIKKDKESLYLELQSTTDIAASLGSIKKKDQILAGFALETNNELSNAQAKMKSKNFDFIVLNSLNDVGAGFQMDTNMVSIIGKDNNIEKFELKSKAEVAIDIVKKLVTLINYAK
jgi:phosphopantothenoylcysteine decarboxylase/phosphopantothenate--cysteine ligase